MTTMQETEQELSVVLPYEDDGSKDAKTHIVKPGREDMRAQDVVDLARMNGTEVVALCGYKWIPKRDPKKYPLCEACVKIWDAS